MAKYMNNHSSNCNQMQRFLDQDSQSTVLATCYSVEPSTSKVHGFHYCTTLGAGKSPPHDILDSRADRTWPGNSWPEYKGEATHNIPEECERLFCDRLSATFLGERKIVGQESLGMDAFRNVQSNQIGLQHARIQQWIEVWDYTSDAIYRGFVAEHNKERTLFVFFEDRALEHGLKSGLIALFELADIATFGCSQIVACVSRSQRTDEMELVRSLGWCGFSLTTLAPWVSHSDQGPCLSNKWLFLAAEV
ncbi:Ornithine decarboxylase antizyme [Penicillium roqueforti FM164]|uniref:Ornithine decarboxylase antizyme n=1 Tax=Penicillium roqueforti (strain FM164) TaxID=1365484 RepID=W6PY73_PENRF|nr:Ornithine decarboxylase antizyme [Penicillium roqueforti FM164]